MFRDFIYLDTNRVQSVLAQLHGGLITELAEESEKSASLKASLDPGLLLKHLLGLGIEASAEVGASFSASHNKILHDYAFNVALEALDRKGYLLKPPELDLHRDDDPFPLGGGEFILVRGSARMLDYAVFSPLFEQAPTFLEHWPTLQPHIQPWLERLAQKRKGAEPRSEPQEPTPQTPSAPPHTNRMTNKERRAAKRAALEASGLVATATSSNSVVQAIPTNGSSEPDQAGHEQSNSGAVRPDTAVAPQDDTHALAAKAIQLLESLFDMLLGDVIQFHLAAPNEVTFKGNLAREFLREDVRSLIFKYGALPQGDWTMLAQVSSVPPRGQQENLVAGVTSIIQKETLAQIGSVADVVDLLLLGMNMGQELIRTVAYPAIAVAPIAIYRETTPLR